MAFNGNGNFNRNNNGQRSSYREDPMKKYENIIKKDDIYGEE